MLRLEPMTESEFNAYLDRILPDYAEQHVEAGNWEASEALDKAKEQISVLLPQGYATPHHHFLNILSSKDQAKAGILWWAENRDGEQATGFIYDLEVAESHQRQGIAFQAMSALENLAAEAGIDALHLHVFADNQAARALYQKLGYETIAEYNDQANQRVSGYRMMKPTAKQGD